MKWLRNKIRYWIITIVINNIVIGAHCGLCGTWMKHEVTDVNWPWSICEECIKR